MLKAIARRLLHTFVVLALVGLGIMLLLELVPGDPAVSVLGPDASAEEYERVREQLGLDDPLLERYATWMGDVVQGDLGNSVARPDTSVWSLITARLPVTAQIAGMALAMSLLVAIPLGVAVAARPGSKLDRAVSFGTSSLLSLPPFVSGLLLIFLFVFEPDIARWAISLLLVVTALAILAPAIGSSSRRFNISSAAVLRLAGGLAVLGLGVLLFFWWPSFPRQGFSRLTDEAGLRENLRSAFLPALTVALNEVAIFVRLLRSDMMTTLQEDFVLASRAKGMPRGRILVRDALRPSSFSLVTLAGVSLGRLLGGTVIVETIFNLPGMGRLIVQEGVVVKDFTVVQGAVLVIAVIYVVLNMLVDASYQLLDPRVRGRSR